MMDLKEVLQVGMNVVVILLMPGLTVLAWFIRRLIKEMDDKFDALAKRLDAFERDADQRYMRRETIAAMFERVNSEITHVRDLQTVMNKKMDLLLGEKVKRK